MLKLCGALALDLGQLHVARDLRDAHVALGLDLLLADIALDFALDETANVI